MIKRFQIETTTLDEKMFFIKDHNKSKLLYATTREGVELEYYLLEKGKKEHWTIGLDEFIDLKGWKAIGNRLSDKMIRGIKEITPEEDEDAEEDDENLKPGDTIELF